MIDCPFPITALMQGHAQEMVRAGMVGMPLQYGLIEPHGRLDIARLMPGNRILKCRLKCKQGEPPS